MKITKLISLLLAVLMLILSTVGCAGEAQSVMTYGSNVIDENEFCYMMSNYKAIYLYNLFGLSEDKPELWSTEIAEGVTVSDYLSALAASTIMSIVLYLGLFDDYGLTLSAEELATVDSQMDKFIESAGSKSALNKTLAPYGANIDTMRSIIVDSLKVAKLKAFLYGEGGKEAATDEEISEYYKENYMCAKLIFISSLKEYEYDANGELIYDESTGAYKTRTLTDDEKVTKKSLYDDLCARVNEGEDFDTLMREYTMNLDMLNYEDGYYFTSTTSFLENEIISAVSEMEIGTTKALETGSGWYILKRCELRDKAYSDKKYETTMFGDLLDSVNSAKLEELITPLAENVVVNEDIIALYPMEYCTPNFSILTGQIPG